MSHPTLEHRLYLDSLGITECGPLSYHDLVVKACSRGMIIDADFDRALALALNVCLAKAQFAACTAEEQKAHHEQSIHPSFDKKPEPETTIYPPPEELMFKLIQQRSDWIGAGKPDEEDP